MRSLLLTMLLVGTALNAQTPFAPIGAKWTYLQGSWAGPDTTIATIEAVSDTVVGGRTCTKLIATTGWFGCHSYVQYVHVSNDSMYYYNSDDDQFHLLFRWNAFVGESWSTRITQTGIGPDSLLWTVTDTGHVVVDGLSLRRLSVSVSSANWYYETPIGAEVIERLGSSGPFAWKPSVCDGEVFLGIRCYEDADIAWLNPQYAQCALGVGIEYPSSSQRPIVRPTLATSGEPIQLIVDQGALDVFDATGRTVLSHSVHRNTFIQLERCGTYLLRFTGLEGSVATQRIVVIP